MSYTTTINAALFRGETAAELLPLDMIEPWEHNPRRTRDQTKLGELADSIAKVGVLQPILVRPVRDGAMMSIVIGERRWRAAKFVGLTHIPAVVRDLSEAEALELAVTENLQREDVPPLEEAEGYERLHDAFNYSVDQIADRVGKSRTYVYARLKLMALCPEAREVVREAALSPTLALLVARIPVPSQQLEAAKAISADHSGRPMVAVEAARFIQRRYMLDLTSAKFDTTDATLCAAAGACTDCQKRTGNQPELFGDISQGDTCTDSTCFDGKLVAAHDRRAAEYEARGVTVMRGDEARQIVTPHGGVRGGYVNLDDECPHDHNGQRTWREVLAGSKVTVSVVDAGEDHGFIEVAPAEKAAKVLVKKGLMEEGHAAELQAPVHQPASESINRDRERSARVALLRSLIDPWPRALTIHDLRAIAMSMAEFFSPQSEQLVRLEAEICGEEHDEVGRMADFIERADADAIARVLLLMTMADFAVWIPTAGSDDPLFTLVMNNGGNPAEIMATAYEAFDALQEPPKPARKKKAAKPARKKKAAKTGETADAQ